MKSPLSAARLRRALPTGRRAVAASVVVVPAGGGRRSGRSGRDRPGFRTESALLDVRSGPGGDEPVDLDTTFYLPRAASADRKVPAVLLAHGFGGTKDSVRADAEDAGRTAATRC